MQHRDPSMCFHSVAGSGRLQNKYNMHSTGGTYYDESGVRARFLPRQILPSKRVYSSPKHPTAQQVLLHFERTLEGQVTAKVLDRVFGLQQRRRNFFIRHFVVGGPKKFSAVFLCTLHVGNNVSFLPHVDEYWYNEYWYTSPKKNRKTSPPKVTGRNETSRKRNHRTLTL